MAALAGLIGQTVIRGLAYKSWAPTLESELAAGRDNRADERQYRRYQ